MSDDRGGPNRPKTIGGHNDSRFALFQKKIEIPEPNRFPILLVLVEASIGLLKLHFNTWFREFAIVWHDGVRR